MFLPSILNLPSLSLRPFILFLSLQARKKRPAPTQLTTASRHGVELFSRNTYLPSCFLGSFADALRASVTPTLYPKFHGVCRHWTETCTPAPKPWCSPCAPRLSHSWTSSGFADEHLAVQSTAPSACRVCGAFMLNGDGVSAVENAGTNGDSWITCNPSLNASPAFLFSFQHWPCTHSMAEE